MSYLKKAKSQHRINAVFEGGHPPDILECITDAFVALDTDWRFTYVNGKAAEILKRDPEYLIGRHIWTEFHEGIVQLFYKACSRAAKEQVSIHIEEYYPPRDLWFEGHIYPSEDGLSIFFRDITERKKTEEELRQSEEKYRSLVDNNQDGIFIIQDARLQFVNESFARICGYTVKEVIGKDFRDMVAPEYLGMVMSYYSRRQAGENVPKEYEFGLLHGDGKTRIIVNASVGIINYRGRVATMGTLKDITGQKRAQEELKRITRALETVTGCCELIIRAREETGLLNEICRLIIKVGGYRMAWIGFAGHDGKTISIMAKAVCETMDFGTAMEEIEPDREQALTAMRTGKPYICRNILTNPECTLLRDEAIGYGYASILVLPLKYMGKAFGALTIYCAKSEAFDEEEVKLLTGLSEDLVFGIVILRAKEERKKAQQALNQRILEMSVLNTVGHKVSMSLSPGQVVNAALEGISMSIRYDLGLLYLRQDEKLVLEGLRPDIPEFRGKETYLHVGDCLCGLAVSQGLPVYSENIHSDPKCTLAACKEADMHSFAALPLVIADKIIGVLGLAWKNERSFAEDATFFETIASQVAVGLHNALLYEEVQKHAALLEMRVRDRTLELEKKNVELVKIQKRLIDIVEELKKSTTELQSANRRLSELDRLKSLFIASTSHELRTPLNTIIGFSSILIEGWSGSLNREQKEQLNLVLASGKHLLALINDVIDISKIEAGKLDIYIQDFNLKDIVREAECNVRPGIEEKGLALIVEVPDINMTTDPRRLLQCLNNLLSNAMKFTEKGTIILKAKSINSMIDISVTDTGIGITEDNILKLFGPFVRLESPLRSRTPGTGLGLYLTKKLVLEVLGGSLDVKSKYGSGSTFTLHIPVIKRGKNESSYS